MTFVTMRRNQFNDGVVYEMEQKGQLPGQPGQQEVTAESAAPRGRGGRPRKAERYVQISAVLPPDLKRTFFATVPPGRRSGLIASLLADWLEAECDTCHPQG